MKEVTEDGAHPPIPENESGKQICNEYGFYIGSRRMRVKAWNWYVYDPKGSKWDRWKDGMAAASCWEEIYESRAALRDKAFWRALRTHPNTWKGKAIAKIHAHRETLTNEASCARSQWRKWAKGEEWQ